MLTECRSSAGKVPCILSILYIQKENQTVFFAIKWIFESFRQKNELHFPRKADAFTVSESVFCAFNLYEDCVAASQVFAVLVQRVYSALVAWVFPCNRQALTETQWPAPSHFQYSFADIQNMELVHRFLQVWGCAGIPYRAYVWMCILQQCLWISFMLGSISSKEDKR